MKTKRFALLSFLLALCLFFTGCDLLLSPSGTAPVTTTPVTTAPVTSGLPSVAYEPLTLPDGTVIPAYAGEPYAVIGDGTPTFTAKEIGDAVSSYEEFSPHDTLGRCGVAEASVGVDLMPTDDRESIGSVKPAGWHTVKYDIVSGKYLYNRCHLIGFQLTGENANEENLITGTRYMNWDGMVPFENMIAAYVKETENHVLYRVTPVYIGNELLARGLLLEAYSIEDEGDGILFYVYVYNVQPGIVINYADGTSYLSGDAPTTQPPMTTVTPTDPDTPAEEVLVYIVNTNSLNFHKESCRYASSIKEENRDTYECTRSFLIEMGFDPCGTCKP